MGPKITAIFFFYFPKRLKTKYFDSHQMSNYAEINTVCLTDTSWQSSASFLFLLIKYLVHLGYIFNIVLYFMIMNSL